MRKYLSIMSFAVMSLLASCGTTEAPTETEAAPGPDWSGVWVLKEAATAPWAPGWYTHFTPEVPLQQAALEHCRKVGCARGVNSAGEARGNAYLQAEDPAVKRCAPQGFPRLLLQGGPMEIFQTSDRVLMRFEVNNELREIWTDGRGHPEYPNLTWTGHSIGRWEGDTLLVDTIAILDSENGKYKWFDVAGHPHSEELHVTERIRRTESNTLEFDLTFEDPKTFTEPVRGRVVWELNPDEQVLEYVQCEDRIFADEAGEAWPFFSGDYPEPQFPPAGPEL